MFDAYRPAWQARGACRCLPVDLFIIAAKNTPDRTAVDACAGCPVRQQCLEYALADPSLVGLWGGTTERERRTIRRARRAVA